MKDKITVFIFILIIILFPIFSLIIKDKEISFYERRKLMSFEKLKKDPLENIDKYISDQLPLRNNLISLNSTVERYVLGNKEKNDIYIKDDYLIEKNYPQDNKSVDNFINKINHINNTYLQNSNTYIGIIPDKAYFLDNNYLKIDYDNLYNELEKKISINYIDLKDIFELNDYYKTDIHLDQQAYFKLIKVLDKELNFNYKELKYTSKTYNNFYGSSYSKSPLFTEKDTITYYTNDIIEKASVNHLEYGERKVYDTEKLGEIDSYNLFLSGPSALIEIENKESITDKELIIFRDSFSSSLAPLLIPYYKKITLIDLRYIRDDLLVDKVEYVNKDVLILFSTSLVNNSFTLKVNS